VKEGKRALGRDARRKVDVTTGRFACSLDLDRHFASIEPNSERWDYVVVVAGGGSGRVAGVEVHPATAAEVSRVIAKQAWARRRLQETCAPAVPAADAWHWVASGKVYLRATDPQARRLRQSGIQGPQTRLSLSPGS
jgi:hypothetical protein